MGFEMVFFNKFFIEMTAITWLTFLKKIRKKISVRYLVFTIVKVFFSKPSIYIIYIVYNMYNIQGKIIYNMYNIYIDI